MIRCKHESVKEVPAREPVTISEGVLRFLHKWCRRCGAIRMHNTERWILPSNKPREQRQRRKRKDIRQLELVK